MAELWESIFTKSYPQPGASDAELETFRSTVCQPLSKAEIRAIVKALTNPYPKKHPLYKSWKPLEPQNWQVPSGPLPPSYLDFLRWSNGGSFFNQERSFDPIFSADQVRDYLKAYHVPEYMPGALPFAFDGGGKFYMFDMRKLPKKGEYPILFAASGSLGFDDAIVVAKSFPEACKGTTNPDD